MGVLKQNREQGAGLSRVEREVTVSAFCRRRLAILMVRSGMVENVKAVCFSLSLSLSLPHGYLAEWGSFLFFFF